MAGLLCLPLCIYDSPFQRYNIVASSGCYSDDLHKMFLTALFRHVRTLMETCTPDLACSTQDEAVWDVMFNVWDLHGSVKLPGCLILVLIQIWLKHLICLQNEKGFMSERSYRVTSCSQWPHIHDVYVQPQRMECQGKDVNICEIQPLLIFHLWTDILLMSLTNWTKCETQYCICHI